MPRTLDQFEQELLRWENTPYSHGMSQCRAGVDCLHFGCAIMDWLLEFDIARMPPIPLLPAATATHRADLAWGVIKFVIDRYDLNVIWHKTEPTALASAGQDDFLCFPGDIVAMQNAVNPCHMLIAGPDVNTFWHAMPNPGVGRGGMSGGRVCKTGWGWCLNTGISRIYRSPLLRFADD